MHGKLEEVGPGLWTVSAPLKLMGAEFGTRMTVVRLTGGSLMLISPIPIDAALAEELETLGPVRVLVAPNAFHHFYFGDAALRYPEATRFGAAGTEKKLGALGPSFNGVGDGGEVLWKSDLDHVVLEGVPATNEIIFHHAASKTVVLTDLCFHFEPPPSGWTGLFLRLAGARGGLRVSRLMRASIKDKAKARASIDRVLEWDFDNLVVAHGANLRGGARERLREATADL